MRALGLTLAFALSTPVLAQDEAGSQGSTSADVRASKNWGVGLGLGLFLTPVTGRSLQGFYAFSSSSQLELQLWDGTWDAADLLDSTTGITLQKFDVNATQIQARWKYFVGNSFYVAGGLGIRKIEFDLEASDNSGTRLKGNLQSHATIINLAIGNTWTFDSGFYIGGEWLAVAVPMGAGFSTEFTMTGPNTGDLSDLEKDSRQTAQDLGEITTFGLATLQLGFQF